MGVLRDRVVSNNGASLYIHSQVKVVRRVVTGVMVPPGKWF